MHAGLVCGNAAARTSDVKEDNLYLSQNAPPAFCALAGTPIPTTPPGRRHPSARKVDTHALYFLDRAIGITLDDGVRGPRW